MDKTNLKKNLSLIGENQTNFEYNLVELNKEIDISPNEEVSLLFKIISIIGSVLVTASFYGFLSLMGILDTDVTVLVSGIMSTILSIFLINRGNSIVVETLAVTVFIIGIILIALGLDFFDLTENLRSCIVLSLGLICLPLQRNYLISWICLLTICFNLYFIVFYNNWPASYHLLNVIMLFAFYLICIKESGIIAKRDFLAKKYFPIRSAFLISVFIGFSMNSLTGFYQEMNYLPYSGMAPVLFSYYLIYVIFQKEFNSPIKFKVLIFSILTLLVFPMLMSPGLGISICLFLLCFKIGYRWGIILSIVGIIYFLGQFYYDLNYTLLTKSFILILTGLILIPIQIIFSRMKKHGI